MSANASTTAYAATDLFDGLLAKRAREKVSPARRGRDPYTPRGAMATLQEATDPEILLDGPAGTGKSRGCLERLHRDMEQYPGARALIVRKTRASLAQSALVTFEQHVLGPDHPLMARPIQRTHREHYLYPNGSEVVVGGLDKPTKVMSTEYDLIYVQEAIELVVGDWEALTSRNRNGVLPHQQIIADCNPDRPTHWLKEREKRGALRMLPTRHEDNPRLYDVEHGEWTEFGRSYIAKLDNLTGVRKERLRYGRWVAAEGLVYEEYDRAVHLIDRFEIPADWRRIRSIDFGYTNPFVCQWWAIDPDGRMYLYREIYRSHRLVEDHARQIIALSEGERIEATVADHDAEDRATLEKHGVKTTLARKEISPGIQTVQERLRIAGDDKPRLCILRDSLVELDDDLLEAGKPTSTEQEIDGYAWPKGDDGKPVKEVPVDLDNHGMDATRYAAMYLGRPAVIVATPSSLAGASKWVGVAEPAPEDADARRSGARPTAPTQTPLGAPQRRPGQSLRTPSKWRV